jgi:hypothetical protein
VRAAYPGYSGARPKIQLWHGAKDDILAPVNFDEEIEQWTNVLGVSQTATTTENNKPLLNYVRTRYANGAGVVMVEAIKATDQGHNCTISEDSVIAFFGLDVTTPGLGGGGAQGIQPCAGFAITLEKSSAGALRIIVSSTPGWINLDLYNLCGAKIRTIAGHNSPTGKLTVSWAAGARGGLSLPTGMYIVAATVNGMPLAAYPAAMFVGR